MWLPLDEIFGLLSMFKLDDRTGVPDAQDVGRRRFAVGQELLERRLELGAVVLQRCGSNVNCIRIVNGSQLLSITYKMWWNMYWTCCEINIKWLMCVWRYFWTQIFSICTVVNGLHIRQVLSKAILQGWATIFGSRVILETNLVYAGHYESIYFTCEEKWGLSKPFS